MRSESRIMLKVWCLASILIICASMNGQDTIYVNSRFYGLTKLELIKKINDHQETLKEGRYFSAEVNHIETKKDTVVCYFNFSISNEKPVSLVTINANVEKIGVKFPNFKISSDTTLSLNSFLGKPVFINFWFTDCPPCVAEIPVLNTFYETYKESITFIAVTFEPEERVGEFLSKTTFPFIMHADEFNLQKWIGLDGYPKNVLLNEHGEVVRIFGGVPFVVVDGVRKIGEGKEIERELEKIISQ